MNKKKLMCILLAVTTVCCNLLVTDTRAQSPATEQQEETKGAQESKGNEAEFQIKNGVLVRYTGGGGDVVIPEGVTSIGDGAFGVHYALISITIPEGVTSIGKAAFGNCSNLESISIPTSVTSIGWAAFAGCSSLTNIVIPEGIAIIEDYTFKDCSNLKNFAIPKGVISIGVVNRKSKPVIIRVIDLILSERHVPDGEVKITFREIRLFIACDSYIRIRVEQPCDLPADAVFLHAV